jgi:hypothetical protein
MFGGKDCLASKVLKINDLFELYVLVWRAFEKRALRFNLLGKFVFRARDLKLEKIGLMVLNSYNEKVKFLTNCRFNFFYVFKNTFYFR